MASKVSPSTPGAPPTRDCARPHRPAHPTGPPCRRADRTDTRAPPSLSHAVPCAASRHSLVFADSSPSPPARSFAHSSRTKGPSLLRHSTDSPLRRPSPPPRPTDSAPLGAAVGPDRCRPPTGASRVAHPPLSMPAVATPPAQSGGCSCRSLPLPTAAFSLSRWERLAHSLLSGPARRSQRMMACKLAESLADCRTLRLLRCLHSRSDCDRLERHLPGGNRTRREEGLSFARHTATPALVWSAPHCQGHGPRLGLSDDSILCSRSCGRDGVWARRWATRPHRRICLAHTLARVVHGLVHTAVLAPVRQDSSTPSTGQPAPSLSLLTPCPDALLVVVLGPRPRTGPPRGCFSERFDDGGRLHACLRPRDGSRRCSRAPMDCARGDLFTQTALMGLARAQAHATPVLPVLPSSSAHSHPLASSPWKETDTALTSPSGDDAQCATPAFASYPLCQHC